MTTPTAQLTPSETLFVHGAALTPAAGTGYKIPSGHLVDPNALAYGLLQVAILANEHAGALGVELGVKKSLFGLRKTPEVRLRPGETAASWPAGTLEALVLEVVRGSGDPADATPSSVMYGVLREETSNPAVEVLELVATGLYERGLAEARSEEATTTEGFQWTRTWAELNDAGRALASQHPAGEALRLLDRMRGGRPDVWPLFEREVANALYSRETALRSFPDAG